jgi:membrane protease YdiL (CAAX protease family)
MFVSWLVFAAINPWFEEGYFRGLLLDAAEGWPAALAIGYAVGLFAISHPLIWGVHSIAMAHPAALVGLAIVGTAWSIVYWRTRSLRFTVGGHMCANLLSLSLPLLLNLHIPAALAR